MLELSSKVQSPANIIRRRNTYSAGDAYAIEPGHDAWVVGDMPAVATNFMELGAKIINIFIIICKKT